MQADNPAKTDSEHVSHEEARGYFCHAPTVRHYMQSVGRVGLWASEKIVFDRWLPREGVILDLGCGAGRISLGLSEMGFPQVTGFDYSGEMIREARLQAELRKVQISFSVADARCTGAGNASFDAVVFGFNGWMQNPGRSARRAILREIRRILRPGGLFICTTHDRDLAKYRSFWRQEEEAWAQGFQDPRLLEFGDRLYECEHGTVYIHIPDRLEILEDFVETGFQHLWDAWRREIALENASVLDFADECRFWVACKSDVENNRS